MAPPFGTRALADQQNLNAKPKSTKQFELQVDPSQYLIPELVPGLHVDDVYDKKFLTVVTRMRRRKRRKILK